MRQDDDEELADDLLALSDYLSIFVGLNDQTKEIGDSRSLLYRGQANEKFGLTPSIFRNGLLKNEHVVIQKLLLKASGDFSETLNPFDRLAKMQHYGLPTRLLDLTANPLVALYFACIDCPDENGEIVVFYDYMQNCNSADVCMISAMAEYSGKSEQSMRTFLSNHGFPTASIETTGLLKMPYVLVEPTMNNERIKRQSGAFAIIGMRSNANGYEKEEFDLRDMVVVSEDEGITRSITIPKKSKTRLLEELDVIGINKAFLFPELEHQASYLKSKYEEI